MKYRRRLIPKNVQIISLIFILTNIWAIIMYFGYQNITVSLKGDVHIFSTINEPYFDGGFCVYENDKLVKTDNYSYTKSSNVDITKLGTYTYAYEIDYNGKSYHLQREVTIIDDVVPVIDLKTTSVKRDYCTKKIENTLEFKAIDNYDGDITDSVIVTEQNDKYVLTVTDSSNNKTTREVLIVDGEQPKNTLKLNGNKTINVKLNGKYEEQGATYSNGCSIDKKANIIIEGEVDTSRVGTYIIKYSYNKSSVTRKVVVYEPTKQEESHAKKIIYLTFDDGPSKYTKRLLDILDKYGIKATFFVVGTNTSIIKEEYNRGHAIGVHSLTHNWSIYRSLESYLDDFNKINDIIEKQTGNRSMIFRFPGGSSNSVSKRYATGIVKKIADYMTKSGYVYFDWNVSAGDASGNTGEEVYRNVVNGVKNCTKCVILMHDSKQKTVNQVENIIKTFIDRGYEFRTLDTNGPIVHHHIKN